MSTTVRTAINGKRKQRTFSAGTDEQNKAAAAEWLHYHERLRAGLSGHDAPTTLEEVVDRYIGRAEDESLFCQSGDSLGINQISATSLETITHGDGYLPQIKRLLGNFGPSHMPIFHQREINEYVSGRRARGAGRGIIKELTVLRIILRYSSLPIEWSVPRSLHRIPKQQRYTPTPSDVRIILQESEPNVRKGVAMALLAGLRAKEVLRVTWDSIDKEGGILCVPAAIRKNGVENVLPLVGTLNSILDPERTGKICQLYPSGADSALRSITRKHGMTSIRGLQAFRRSLCTWAEDAGFTQDTIALVTGHSRGSMVSRYASSNGRMDLKREVIEAVERRLHE